MTQDEIIEMVKQAGWKDLRDFDSEMNEEIFMGRFADLEVFAKLVADKEREACAKVCEQSEILIDINVWHGSTKKEMTQHTALALAKAIRARGQA